MYWVLACLVVMSGVCFGQVDGPWLVQGVGTDQRILRPELVVQPDGTVDVFYVVRNADSTEQLLRTNFSFPTRTSTLPYVVATNDSSWLSIGAASRLDNGQWAVLSYDKQRVRSDGNSFWNRTRLFAGRDSVHHSQLADSAFAWFYPRPGGHYHSNLRLIPRVGGGVVASWTTNGSQDFGGFGEPLYGAAIKLYAEDMELSHESWGAINSVLYGSREFIALSTEEDSIEIVSVDDALNGVLAYYPAEQTEYLFETFYCGWHPLLFWLSAGGQRLVLTSDFDMPIYHLIQLTEGANCEELSSFSLDLYGGIMATEPEFGLAIAYIDPQFMHLLRWAIGSHNPGTAGYFIERPSEVRMDSAAIAIGDDGHVVAIWTEDTGLGIPNQLMIARVAWEYPLESTAKPVAIPTKYALSAFPNPFNSALRIRYELAQTQTIELKIYDVAGREVATLLEDQVNAGVHEVMWNADGFSSGVYFVRLIAEEEYAVQKVLLMK